MMVVVHGVAASVDRYQCTTMIPSMRVSTSYFLVWTWSGDPTIGLEWSYPFVTRWTVANVSYMAFCHWSPPQRRSSLPRMSLVVVIQWPVQRDFSWQSIVALSFLWQWSLRYSSWQSTGAIYPNNCINRARTIHIGTADDGHCCYYFDCGDDTGIVVVYDNDIVVGNFLV